MQLIIPGTTQHFHGTPIPSEPERTMEQRESIGFAVVKQVIGLNAGVTGLNSQACVIQDIRPDDIKVSSGLKINASLRPSTHNLKDYLEDGGLGGSRLELEENIWSKNIFSMKNTFSIGLDIFQFFFPKHFKNFSFISMGK